MISFWFIFREIPVASAGDKNHLANEKNLIKNFISSFFFHFYIMLELSLSGCRRKGKKFFCFYFFRYRIIAIGILITCNSKDEANNNGSERAKARHHYREIHLTLEHSQRLNQLIFSTFYYYVRLAIISEQIIYNENLIENCVAWATRAPSLYYENK